MCARPAKFREWVTFLALHRRCERFTASLFWVEGQFDCWLCSLEGKDRQYSTLTVRFPWETCKKTLYSHRFSYMIFNRVFDLSKDIHVSHICHQRRCINPAHLSYEPNHVNQDRQVCRGIVPAQCKAHQLFPDCLLLKAAD